MNTPQRFLLLALLTAACGAQSVSSGGPSGPDGVTYGGGDGSSCAQAIIPQGVKGEHDGVASEYAWLKAKYPGCQTQGQSLSECNGKPADIITIATADGQEKKVYFDISGFFGQF